MNDELSRTNPNELAIYIETPRIVTKPEKIDALLERRMREFLLARRRRLWREEGV